MSKSVSIMVLNQYNDKVRDCRVHRNLIMVIITNGFNSSIIRIDYSFETLGWYNNCRFAKVLFDSNAQTDTRFVVGL